MSRLPVFILTCLSVAPFTIPSVRSQGSFEGVAEPSVSFSYKLGKQISQNASFSQRAFWYRENSSFFRSRHTEIAVFTAYEWVGGHSLGLGLGYRFRDIYESGRTNEFRLTEQYNLAYRLGPVRFGHRFRAEQRFFAARTAFRFRYRFALDGPMQGERLDVGEFYWAAHLEQLLGMASAVSPRYDLRTGFLLGYQMGVDAKWQAGCIYRLEGYTRRSGHALFLVGGLVLSL